MKGKKVEEILFIGLVNFNTEKGDAVHFKKLSNFLTQKYNGRFITLTDGKSDSIHKKIRFPSNKIFRLIYWNIIIFYNAFFFLLTNKKIKVVYFRESGLVISPYFLKLFFRTKLIVEINGVNIDDLSIPKSITKPLFKLLYKISDFITASRGYVKLLNMEFIVPLSKFIKVQLGYDPYLPKTRSECFKHVELNSDKKYLLFIGNLTAYQGLQNVIPALKGLFEKDLDLRLLIVGDGYYLEEVKRLVNEYSLNERTIFIPRVSKDLIRYYVGISEIGLSPFSFNRGIKGSISGLKTFDYLFGGLPIFTSEMDDMAIMIKDNKWGEYFKESDDIQQIEGMIQNLLINNMSYRKNVVANRDLLHEKFSWENRFSKIINKIEQMLKKK
jgi:glycosyltransferase involved in cell wall biosynthesis